MDSKTLFHTWILVRSDLVRLRSVFSAEALLDKAAPLAGQRVEPSCVSRNAKITGCTRG